MNAQQQPPALVTAPIHSKRLVIKIFSPYRILYFGTGQSLSARNEVGPFDILYDHSNFFSLLEPGNITIDKGDEKVEFLIENGFIKVTKNNIVVFAVI